MSPALAGGFLTTAPPGKSQTKVFKKRDQALAATQEVVVGYKELPGNSLVVQWLGLHALTAGAQGSRSQKKKKKKKEKNPGGSAWRS